MPAFPNRRPPQEQRCFLSPHIEQVNEEVSGAMADRELAWMFTNCFPNTLDTTVTLRRDPVSRPDTYVITGDIDAMWLRDSTAQVWPYLLFIERDRRLCELIQGVIRRQVACVRLDPYANAFYADPTKVSPWTTDQTDMKPGVHERKYELDSLCAVMRLACGYFTASHGDLAPFDAPWHAAMELILQTIRAEQAGTFEQPGSPYHFARVASRATETMPLDGGQSHPIRRCGLSRSPFRPSDDATQLPFHVPSNAMAVVCLRGIGKLLTTTGATVLAADATHLADEIDAGIQQHAIAHHPTHGEILAYEIDGYGSRILMDDANVPSLLALPYLGYCPKDDPLYRRTRGFILSPDNPYFSHGNAGRGVGGPHVGPGWIWPLSMIIQALTSDCDEEIRDCLGQLKQTHAGTGFIHESFWKDDAAKFTRAWFAWANTLFGELILTLHRQRPHLLR